LPHLHKRDYHALKMSLPPGLTQTVKTLFAVR
jgi:hypothetical protein